MREFDVDTLNAITAFENMTGTEVRDCIINDVVYFLINPGKMAAAIGKNGQTIRRAEEKLKHSIKIMEWSEDETQFVKNMIPQAQSVKINKDTVTVGLNAKDKGLVIGKGGSNINIIKQFLERNSNLKELKLL